MSHPTLERHLKKQTIKPVYLMFGEEEFLLRRALERLQEALGSGEDVPVPKTHMDATEIILAEVLAQARMPMLFSGKQLIILWQVDRYKVKELAPLGRYLDSPSRQTCLVLVSLTLKNKDLERHTYWKRLQEQDAVLGFFRLKESALPRWLEQETGRLGKSLAPSAAQRLIETVGNNLLELTQELEKLVLYVGNEPVIPADAVTHLSSHSRSHNIFELVEALGQKRPAQALQVLDRLLELGEPPLIILVMLARQLRMMIRIKEGRSQGAPLEELSARIGLPRGIADKLIRQAEKFRLGSLKKHLDGLHQTDLSMKTGGIAPRLLLEKVILDMYPMRRSI
jgi:DNA polymerase-3 subunit delta